MKRLISQLKQLVMVTGRLDFVSDSTKLETDSNWSHKVSVLVSRRFMQVEPPIEHLRNNKNISFFFGRIYLLP